jgi:hypothetical protein
VFAVVLDTCVLYPQYLRDTLLRLAERRLYNPLWSADIRAELHRVPRPRSIGGSRPQAFERARGTTAEPGHVRALRAARAKPPKGPAPLRVQACARYNPQHLGGSAPMAGRHLRDPLQVPNARGQLVVRR